MIEHDNNKNIVKTLTLSALKTYSLSARVFNFCEKFEYGVLKNISIIKYFINNIYD